MPARSTRWPAILEEHFPYYIDATDLTNIDCDCGQEISTGIAGWAEHVAQFLPLRPTPLTTIAKAYEC